MKVVALFRVSTEKQSAEGASLDAQERDYRELAARNAWATVAEFKGSESATQAATDRRVLQQVLACIREHAVDALYVHEQSRLTRGDELEVASLMRELKERRLKIIVHGVVRDLASIDERFMVGIQSLVDRAEAERIKERLSRGKREKARQGKRASGAPPFGYSNPVAGQPGRGVLQVVPEEAAVVRRLFALAGSGLGDRAVAERLNALGHASPRGGRWHKSGVRAVLRNPAYLGILASGVWKADPGTRRFRFDLHREGAIVKEGAHEPIIDRAAWDAVHGRARIPRTSVPRLLTGLLYVGGLPYQGDSSRHGRFYRAARGHAGTPWLNAAATDQAVWDAFASLATGPEYVARILNAARTPGEQARIAQGMEYAEGQIDRRRKRLANLVEMRTEGDITGADFRARSEAEKKAIAELERELAALRSRAASGDRTLPARVARAVQVLLAGGARLTVAQKRSLLRSIVRRVDIAAVTTGVRQQRVEGGRFAGTGGARWAVAKVEFRLALPAADANGANVGRHAGNGAKTPAEPGGCRDGRLATTYWDCGQAPVADGGYRDGRLATTP